MKTNKGFTLVELLAVIVILAIILVIAIPNIMKIIDKAKLDANIKSEDMLLNAAKKYMVNNFAKVPINIGDTTEITLDELKTANIMGDIKSANNSNLCNGYVLITKIDDNKYNYTPTLNCNNNIGNSNDDGLKAYFPFDDFQEPTENLYPGPSTSGYYMTSVYNGTNYGFGISTNSKWEIDNSDQPIKNIDVQKTSRIDSGISQRFYVQWTDIANRSGSTYLPGEEKTFSFYYYGTYGTSINPYIGGYTGTLTLYSDQATSGNNTTSIVIPVTENKWNRIVFKVKNTGAINAVYNWGWMILHNNNATATVDNTNYWKFTGIQVEKKSYATPYVNGIRQATVKDYSGNGNNSGLILNNSPKWLESNKIGTGAYEFNGINSCVTLNPSNTIINNNTNWTLSAWFNTNTIGSYAYANRIVALMRTNIASTAVSLTLGSGKVSLMYSDAGTIHKYLSTDISINKWYHVAGTYDGVKYSLYLNGTKIGEVNDTFQGFSTGLASLGCMSNGADFFNGKIDDVRIYNRTLSADEIIQKYKMELSRSN
jgi:prepilin-type N-terminal cleavage/methylation domain-containing protein